MKKIAIITSHPIQYNAPWFLLLAQRGLVTPKVFYTWGPVVQTAKYDPGFTQNIQWDIPLLDGYEYTFVKNVAANPGSHHFRGIINPTLIKEVKQWKPDAVLVFGWAFVSHLKCMRYFHKKIPVLFRGDSTLPARKYGLKNVIRNIFLKWVYRYVDYALYVGKQNKLYFKKHGLREDQLIFAPHAVDNDRFADGSGEYLRAAEDWKKRIGITEADNTIVYAGKMEEIKNPFFIFELAKRLKSMPVKFILTGNGPLEQKLKAEKNGNTRFIFIDFQNQLKMPVVYRLGEFFILPSKSETWGLSVNEAMACGRVALIRDTCGCAEDLVKDGVNGYVFEEKNIEELADKITNLIKDKNAIKRMGEKSLQIIRSYTFMNIVEPLELLMLNII